MSNDNYEPKPGEEFEIQLYPVNETRWFRAYLSADNVRIVGTPFYAQWWQLSLLPMRPLVRPEPPEVN